MNEVNFDKEIEIAIKAAKSAGKFLNEDKNNLNLKIKSNPKDTKLMADIKSEKLILDILNSESNLKSFLFIASNMHLRDEITPEARYGEILLVPSRIGSFLSSAYLMTLVSKQSFNFSNAVFSPTGQRDISTE